jgi:hypothetical protein
MLTRPILHQKNIEEGAPKNDNHARGLVGTALRCAVNEVYCQSMNNNVGDVSEAGCHENVTIVVENW